MFSVKNIYDTFFINNQNFKQLPKNFPKNNRQTVWWDELMIIHKQTKAVMIKFWKGIPHPIRAFSRLCKRVKNTTIGAINRLFKDI